MWSIKEPGNRETVSSSEPPRERKAGRFQRWTAKGKMSAGGNLMHKIDAKVRIGHVHLKVADLERAVDFYKGVLGFEITQKYGGRAAFLSAGGYHHHIALNTWESLGGSPPPQGATGLYHLAILFPTRAALADALRRVLSAGIVLDGAADHGVSEALYLRDPDGNGVELYWDRPPEIWPRTPGGELAMFTRALDVGRLLSENPPASSDDAADLNAGPRDP
jgi:catechol 2,3-dioxygenase